MKPILKYGKRKGAQSNNGTNRNEKHRELQTLPIIVVFLISVTSMFFEHKQIPVVKYRESNKKIEESSVVVAKMPTISNRSQVFLPTNMTGKEENRTSKEAQAFVPTNATEAKGDGTRFFIHVGPVKTGSSSIQCNLQVNPFLKDSSYEFMGRKENVCTKSRYPLIRKKTKLYNLQAFVNQYILRGWLKQEQFQDYVADFKTVFRSKAKAGINTIFSAEEFCLMLKLDPPKGDEDDRLQQFANLLNDIPQRIVFQVFYRHHFDWALSYYTFYGVWPERPNFAYSPGPAPSITTRTDFFRGEIDKHVCSPNAIFSFLKDKLIPLLDRGSVEVFNFHGDGDGLATRYICGLPGTDAACEKTRSNLHLERARVTDTDQLHSDRIAMAAWKKGVYSNSTALKDQRKRIRSSIIDHIRNDLNISFMELELECLGDDVLSESVNASIRIGRQMLGEERLDVEALTSKFHQIKSKRKFCSVNVTAILVDPLWQQFLSTV